MALLHNGWRDNSIGREDLVFTCLEPLQCDDIVRLAFGFEIAITPKDEDVPRWRLKAWGFNGQLLDRTGSVILCEAGKVLRPVTLYYGSEHLSPEQAKVTKISVDQRTAQLWKESFHLLGQRYSWKYVAGRFFCYSVKHRHLFKLPPPRVQVAEFFPARGGTSKPSDTPGSQRALGQLLTYNVDEALLQHVLILSAFNFYAHFKWAKGRESGIDAWGQPGSL